MPCFLVAELCDPEFLRLTSSKAHYYCGLLRSVLIYSCFSGYAVKKKIIKKKKTEKSGSNLIALQLLDSHLEVLHLSESQTLRMATTRLEMNRQLITIILHIQTVTATENINTFYTRLVFLIGDFQEHLDTKRR